MQCKSLWIKTPKCKNVNVKNTTNPSSNTLYFLIDLFWPNLHQSIPTTACLLQLLTCLACPVLYCHQFAISSCIVSDYILSQMHCTKSQSLSVEQPKFKINLCIYPFHRITQMPVSESEHHICFKMMVSCNSSLKFFSLSKTMAIIKANSHSGLILV